MNTGRSWPPLKILLSMVIRKHVLHQVSGEFGPRELFQTEKTLPSDHPLNTAAQNTTMSGNMHRLCSWWININVMVVTVSGDLYLETEVPYNESWFLCILWALGFVLTLLRCCRCLFRCWRKVMINQCYQVDRRSWRQLLTLRTSLHTHLLSFCLLFSSLPQTEKPSVRHIPVFVSRLSLHLPPWSMSHSQILDMFLCLVYKRQENI